MKSKNNYILSTIEKYGKFVLFDLKLTGLKRTLLNLEAKKVIKLIKYKYTWKALLF